MDFNNLDQGFREAIVGYLPPYNENILNNGISCVSHQWNVTWRRHVWPHLIGDLYVARAQVSNFLPREVSAVLELWTLNYSFRVQAEVPFIVNRPGPGYWGWHPYNPEDDNQLMDEEE